MYYQLNEGVTNNTLGRFRNRGEYWPGDRSNSNVTYLSLQFVVIFIVNMHVSIHVCCLGTFANLLVSFFTWRVWMCEWLQGCLFLDVYANFAAVSRRRWATYLLVSSQDHSKMIFRDWRQVTAISVIRSIWCALLLLRIPRILNSPAHSIGNCFHSVCVSGHLTTWIFPGILTQGTVSLILPGHHSRIGHM